MSTELDQILPIVDRLAKLEGLIMGLQTHITNSQTHTAGAIAKVETLEQRQIELERNMVTKDDIAGLSKKVDALVTSDASRKGATFLATWSVNSIATWLALIISLFALLNQMNTKPVDAVDDNQTNQSGRTN